MMQRILPIAAAVIADSLRRKVVYVVLIFAALLVFAIPSLPDYGLGVEGAVFREVSLALTYVTGLVLALSLAANRVPAELERRTVVEHPHDRVVVLRGHTGYRGRPHLEQAKVGVSGDAT